MPAKISLFGLNSALVYVFAQAQVLGYEVCVALFDPNVVTFYRFS